MYRLFVALELPEIVVGALERHQNGLPGARWIDPENFHLTLRFIGEVDPSQAEDIHDALSLVRAQGFTLRLSHFGAFGSGGRPRSLWVGVQKSEPLNRLKARIDHVLRSVGVAPDRRKYSPHVTLARLKGVSEPRLAAFVGARAIETDLAFPVNRFVLFSSFLASGGAIYTPMADYPLSELVA